MEAERVGVFFLKRDGRKTGPKLKEKDSFYVLWFGTVTFKVMSESKRKRSRDI